jgi:hypothetical protein
MQKAQAVQVADPDHTLAEVLTAAQDYFEKPFDYLDPEYCSAADADLDASSYAETATQCFKVAMLLAQGRVTEAADLAHFDTLTSEEIGDLIEAAIEAGEVGNH